MEKAEMKLTLTIKATGEKPNAERLKERIRKILTAEFNMSLADIQVKEEKPKSKDA